MELKIYHISVITFDGSSNGGGGDTRLRNKELSVGLKVRAERSNYSRREVAPTRFRAYTYTMSNN